MQGRAVAHPNIALVKYWGKRDIDRNLPAVGSISITLDTLVTTTEVVFDTSLTEDRLTLDGREDPKRLPRVSHCLDLLRQHAGLDTHAAVDSTNNFPTAAGLASSASGFAALVVAADHALDTGLDLATLSDLARQCSGSAARSLHGGFVELRIDSPDTTPTASIVASDAWRLEVAVAITDPGEKVIGSTEGMRLTEETSPYYDAWVATSPNDLDEARTAIAARDFEALAEVSERSALKMHAVALAARPGLLYWNGTTVDCLHLLRGMRRQGVPVFFTVDAGPQVKAVCLPEVTHEVAAALREVPGVRSMMTTGLGAGARIVEE